MIKELQVDYYNKLQVNCFNEYAIQLLEDIICCKIQCVGKSGTSFNLRLNDHRESVKNPNAIEACKHFHTEKHQFKKQAKFETLKEMKTFG